MGPSGSVAWTKEKEGSGDDAQISELGSWGNGGIFHHLTQGNRKKMVDRKEMTDWTMSHQQLDGIKSEAPVDLTGMRILLLYREEELEFIGTFRGSEEER